MMATRLQRVSISIIVSLILNVIAALDVPPKLDPDTSSMNIASGSTLEIICSGPYELQWTSSSFADDINERMDVRNSMEENTYRSKLTVSNVIYSDTGYFSCSYKGAPEGSLGNTSSVYVFVNDDEYLLAPGTPTVLTISPNKKNIIPCRPTNPDVKVTLKRENEFVSTNSSDIIYDNRVGFTILYANIFYSTSFRCIAELNGKTEEIDIVLFWTDQNDGVPPPSIDLNGYTHIMVRKRFVFSCLINVQDNTTFYFLDWDYPNKSSKRVTVGPTTKTIRTSKNAASGSTIFYETIRNITVEDVEELDEGVYTCTVRNQGGESAAARTYVTVHGKNHSILQIRADFHGKVQKIRAGEDARFIVHVDAQPGPPILIWRKNNEKLLCSGKSNCKIDRGDEKQSTIFLNNVNRNDTANYTLTAKMDGLEQSVTLELWVTDLPTVKIKDTFGYHLEKKRYEINCDVFALPKAEIFWTWNPCSIDGCIKIRHRLSSSLFDKPNRESEREIDMGSYVRSTLTLTALKTGYYTCEASNDLGPSADDYLFIVTDTIIDSVPSGFGIFPFNREPLEKERVVMECHASKFNFTSRLSWKFDSIDHNVKEFILTDETGLTITRTETNFTYGIIATFDSVQLKNSGRYICEAISVLHSRIKHTQRQMKVSAVEAPGVINTNMDGSVYSLNRERGFQFVCNVSGSPTPSITWMKNNETLNAYDHYSQFNFIDDNVILEIPRVVVEDSGVYYCVVSNREGRLTLNATLNVEAAAVASGMSSHVRGIVITIVVIIILIIIILSAILARKCYIDRKEREEIYQLEKELFERGAIERYNPAISMDEQIDILPYDTRWEFPQEKLKLGKTLGQGAFGRVVKAEAYGLIPDEKCTIVAVKMLKEHANIDHRKAIMQELKIMIHLGRHVNILNLLGACILNPRRGELLIIMEHCQYGCLRNYLLRNRLSFVNQINPETGEIDVKFTNAATNLNEPQSPTSPTYNSLGQDGYLVPLSPSISYPATGVTFVADPSESTSDDSTGFGRQTESVKAKKPLTSCDLVGYAFQTARGMEYLATRKLVHRDLALRNILLAKDNIIKICDFGLTKDCYNKAYYRKKGDAPLPVKWMSIEAIRDRIFSSESDVWSFGIVLWELFSLGSNPYPGLDVDENFYKKLLCGYRMDKPEFGTDEFYRIMNECWHSEPQQRPTFSELTQWIGEQLQTGLRDHYIKLNTDYQRLYSPPEANPDYVNMNADPLPDYVNLPSRSSDMSASEDEPPSSKPDYLDMRGSNTPSMKNYQIARAAKNELKPMLPTTKDDLHRPSEQNNENSPLSVRFSSNPSSADRLTVPDNSNFKPPSYSTVMSEEFSV